MICHSERIKELTERAKESQPYLKDCDIGEKCYILSLAAAIKLFRLKAYSQNELKQLQSQLKSDLEIYYLNCKCFERAVEIRNAYSPILTEAEKHGCKICQKIVRIFDGRENGKENQNETQEE